MILASRPQWVGTVFKFQAHRPSSLTGERENFGRIRPALPLSPCTASGLQACPCVRCNGEGKEGDEAYFQRSSLFCVTVIILSFGYYTVRAAGPEEARRGPGVLPGGARSLEPWRGRRRSRGSRALSQGTRPGKKTQALLVCPRAFACVEILRNQLPTLSPPYD